jgi:LemA protein
LHGIIGAMDPNISVAIALGAFFAWALVVAIRLSALRREVSAAYAATNAQSDRLRELSPKIEDAARAHLGHERETLDEVASAREAAQAAAATAPDPFADVAMLSARVDADSQLSSALNRLLAAAEKHPGLGSDPTLQQAAREITDAEDRLSVTRRSYNQSATTYNAALQAFPAAMFAPMAGFKPAPRLR